MIYSAKVPKASVSPALWWLYFEWDNRVCRGLCGTAGETVAFWVVQIRISIWGILCIHPVFLLLNTQLTWTCPAYQLSDFVLPKNGRILQWMSSSRNLPKSFAKSSETKESPSGIQYLVIKEQRLISNKEDVEHCEDSAELCLRPENQLGQWRRQTDTMSQSSLLYPGSSRIRNAFREPTQLPSRLALWMSHPNRGLVR